MAKAKQKKIKVAFVKFGGCAAGGTERFLQSMAAFLPKDRFEVDYFYCDSAPYIGSDWVHPDTVPERETFLKEHGVNLIKFKVGAKDVSKPTHPWVDTNFFEVFNPESYDIVQSGRAGHAEYPFTEIDNTWIVDMISLPNMADNKENVFKSIHLSKFQADSWVAAGGDPSKVEIIPIIQNLNPPTEATLKESIRLVEELGLNRSQFIYGFHQREDDGIFSPIALRAYKEIETDETAFLVMGGSKKYAQLAQELGLKNFRQLPAKADEDSISSFLSVLDVFAHNRSDGETFGAVISEALHAGLPVVSHLAPAMGHVETIGDAGKVCNTHEEYRDEMKKLLEDLAYYEELGEKAKKQYQNNFSVDANMDRLISIYDAAAQKKGPWELTDEEFWEDMWEDE